MKRFLVGLMLWPWMALADDPADTTPAARGSHLCMRALNQWEKWMTAKGVHGIRAVKLDFRVGVDGNVRDLVVGISSEDGVADALALECVRDWRYSPATKRGAPVEVPWTATVSLSTDEDREPRDAEFDAAASSAQAQTCKILSAADIEKRWLQTVSGPHSQNPRANDAFECIKSGNADRVCRALPGTTLYPTLVDSTFYSTGSTLKIGVAAVTAGDCNTILPLSFKDGLPFR